MSADAYQQAVGRVQRDPRYIELDAKRAHWWKVYREAEAEQDRALANSAYNMASDYKRQAEAIMDAALAPFGEVDA